MNELETFAVAARALLRNKTRSFLTSLGIIIGVGAVVAVVSIGEGAKAQVEATFNSMGTNLLIVLSGSSGAGGARGGFGSQPTLTWNDLSAIRDEVSSVRYAAPVLRLSAQVQSDDQNWTTLVQGTSPEYFDIRNWPIGVGRTLTSSDVEAGNKVAVLGQTVVKQLFGAGAYPIGQRVRIKGIPFEVVGVLSTKGQSAMGQDNDDAVFVPHSTFNSKLQGGLGQYLNGIIQVSAVSPQATRVAEQEIGALLRDRHRIPDGGEDDFSVRNLAEFAAAQEQGTQTLSLLLASVAAVSLLVGGIGIMNIMLVSVTERTREIGVRIAVGARPRDILAQFLVEALVLSVAGGIIGLAGGVLAAQRIAASFGWPLLLRPDVMMVAVVFSALVGIAFGLYPARKASRLDPIDALRYE